MSPPAGGDRERGAVTAELALGLPLLLALTVGLVWLLAVGAGQVRVVDGPARPPGRWRGATRGGRVRRAATRSPARAAGSRVATADGEVVVTVTRERSRTGWAVRLPAGGRAARRRRWRPRSRAP